MPAVIQNHVDIGNRMSKVRNSSRNTLLRPSRRKVLAAMLIACGALGTANADEPGRPETERLALLPPLPLEIGQLGSVAQPQEFSGRLTATPVENNSTIRLRSNPYVVSPSGPEKTDGSSAMSLRRPHGIRQVGVVVQAAEEAPELKPTQNAGLRLVPQQASKFALRPVALPNQQTQAIQGSELAQPPQSANDSVVQQNPWVENVEAQPATEERADVVRAEATSDERRQATVNRWADPAKIEHVQTASTHFSLSDIEEGSVSQADAESGLQFNTELRLNDGGSSATAAVAPLLEVAPPVLLQAAAPVDLAEEVVGPVDGVAAFPYELEQPTRESEIAQEIETSGELVEEPSEELRHGDVRSSTGRVSRVQVPIETESALAPLSETEEGEFVRPQLEQSELPIPQVYRPKQSLVIDVPVPRSVTESKIEAVDSQAPSAKINNSFQGEVSQVLSVTIAQSQALTPTQAVRRVELENRDICEAVLVGNHKLLLIGRMKGVTRLAVWCGEDSESQLFEVQVDDGREATPGTSLDGVAKRLTETIAATYPNCRVVVVPRGEGLAVVGRTGNANTAREILRLVRSACLKSVSDELEVR